MKPPRLAAVVVLPTRAPGGIYEMLAFNERRIEQLVSRTAIAGLDLVLSKIRRDVLDQLQCAAAQFARGQNLRRHR